MYILYNIYMTFYCEKLPGFGIHVLQIDHTAFGAKVTEMMRNHGICGNATFLLIITEPNMNSGCPKKSGYQPRIF